MSIGRRPWIALRWILMVLIAPIALVASFFLAIVLALSVVCTGTIIKGDHGFLSLLAIAGLSMLAVMKGCLTWLMSIKDCPKENPP